MKKNKLISVIIPAYKQAKTIKKDVLNIKNVLEKIRYHYELILVVDGCLKTYKVAKRLKLNKVKIYFLKQNQGKGYAIRFGMKKAKGEYVAFLDAGMEIDPNGISLLIEHLEWYEADVIVGSKRHPASIVNYPWERKILSFFYYWLIHLLFGIKVKDTQAGIKIFRQEVLKKVLPVLLIKHYAFDIEILSVAYTFGFKRIYEAPIKLNYQFSKITNVTTLKTIWKMLWDTAAVFYRLKILRYYQKQRKKYE